MFNYLIRIFMKTNLKNCHDSANLLRVRTAGGRCVGFISANDIADDTPPFDELIDEQEEAPELDEEYERRCREDRGCA